MDKPTMPSHHDLTNDMLCTILSEVQSLRYVVQEQNQVLAVMRNQLQSLVSDVLQLRLAQQQNIPTVPLSPGTPPGDVFIAPNGHETSIQQNAPKWDSRDSDFPEAVFNKPSPNMKIPNR